MSKRYNDETKAPKGLDRRTFLQKGIAAGVALGIGFPLTNFATRTLAATPRRGGVLRMSFRSSPARLDPAFAINGEEYVITQAVYDTLTNLDPSFAVTPGLAHTWYSNAEATIWTFELREGVTFHHGRDMTANDVVYSIRRVLDPATASPGKDALGPIERVEALDAHTVRFHLLGPYADFPTIMAQTFGRVLPEEKVGTLDAQPVGTGPFRVVEHLPGQHTRMVRNENYWLDGRPYLDEVWHVHYPEVSTEQAAFQSGLIDVLWEVPTNQIAALQRVSNADLIEIPSPGFQPLAMRSDGQPFSDLRVRQAFKHAINREQLLQVVLRGHGTLGYDHPVPPTSNFASEVEALPYDPELARSLLRDAGYGNGFEMRMYASPDRHGGVETATMVQQMLQAVGVRLSIQQMPWDRLVSEVWAKEQLFVSNWFGRPTIDEQLYPYFHSTGSWNEYHYSDERVDSLLVSARKETDEARRQGLYAEVQQLLATEGPAVIPYFLNYVTAVNKKVKGYVPHPLKWVDLRETYIDA